MSRDTAVPEKSHDVIVITVAQRIRGLWLKLEGGEVLGVSAAAEGVGYEEYGRRGRRYFYLAQNQH